MYFIGQAVSVAGTFMQTIAQAWLVLQLTHSGTALGIVTALQYLPILFLAPFGGLIADRFSKRILLYITQSISAVLALLLGILVGINVVQLWMVYILAFLLGLVNTVDNPVRQAFVFDMVGKNELRNAITLNSIVFNISRIIGPVIAGTIIVAIGIAPCFIINAVSFIAVIISLTMMRASELYAAPLIPHKKGQLMEGFRYVISTPILFTILIMISLIGTLTYEFQVSLPLLAQFTFKGDAATYAWLTAALGFGSAIGGLVLASHKKNAISTLLWVAAIFGITILIAAFMPTLNLSMLALIFVGIFSIYFTSLANSILQLESAPHMRGRVLSFWTISFLGSTAIGGPIIGWIGEHISPQWSLAIGGIAAIIAAGLGLVAARRIEQKKQKVII